MKPEQTIQYLRDEIEEITGLIKEWDQSDNPEILWAIYLLEQCLERRRNTLKQLLH